MLAELAERLEPEALPLPPAAVQALRDLLSRREDLITMRTAELDDFFGSPPQLAGVAPHNVESGQWKGKRRFRAKLRLLAPIRT